jgi:hypothetical protein
MNDDARDFFFRARSFASSIGKIGNIVAFWHSARHASPSTAKC